MIRGHKYVWQLPDVDAGVVRDLAAQCNLSLPVAQVLAVRGYTTPNEVFSFLTPLRRDASEIETLAGASAAVTRIECALENREKILIFGDYDVDGITSTSLLLLGLLPLSADINYYLPHRVRDGYGLSVSVVERAANAGYKLIITVDNGISAYAAATRARELGVDLIITDHHKPHGTLPDAPIIVNPQQSHCSYPFKYFAGVGVIFKIVELLYHRRKIPLPVKISELLMLGTVADVVPLLDENRYWVQEGLRVVNKHESYAFTVLKANGKIGHKAVIDSLDIGFMIAPQLNALGRLDDPRDGVAFLISDDFDKVSRIGATLSDLNAERKRIDQRIYAEVVDLIERGAIDLSREKLIMAVSPDWPPGVIGLVAGKLMHTYGRPTILLHQTSEGIAKGSCRSIDAYNIFDGLTRQSDILLSFGGHAMAAGLSLKCDDIALLKERFEQHLSETLTEDDLVQKLALDAALDLSEISASFIDDLARLEPFGQSNRQPLFVIKNSMLADQPQLLKEQHVKCMLISDDGVTRPIMFFGKPELYDMLRARNGERFAVAAHVVKNEWRGNVSFELQGVDISWNHE